MVDLESRNREVAVFDSGLGGISVLRELKKALPAENFRFFGDSKNAPYGTKSLEEVRALTLSHVDRLVKDGAKAVVVACNTATSAAIQTLRATYSNIPMIGIEPALKPAALFKEHARVIALATEMTIREEKFHELAERFRDTTEILPLPAPKIVTLVEAGKWDGPEMDEYLAELFAPFRGIGVDAIVLGCTHFPFAYDAIRRAWNGEVTLFDGAEGTARELKRQLMKKDLCTTAKGPGKIKLENSLGEEKLVLSRTLLALPEHGA